MKITNVLIALIILFSTSVFAQKPEPRGEKLKAQKVSYITNKVNFSADEAAVFWPVYNEFESKMIGIKRQKRELLKPDQDLENVEEKELLSIMEKRFELDQEEMDLKKSYHKEFLELDYNNILIENKFKF